MRLAESHPVDPKRRNCRPGSYRWGEGRQGRPWATSGACLCPPGCVVMGIRPAPASGFVVSPRTTFLARERAAASRA